MKGEVYISLYVTVGGTDPISRKKGHYRKKVFYIL